MRTKPFVSLNTHGPAGEVYDAIILNFSSGSLMLKRLGNLAKIPQQLNTAVGTHPETGFPSLCAQTFSNTDDRGRYFTFRMIDKQLHFSLY